MYGETRENYIKNLKNTPLIQHTRIETAVNFGVPDVLCYNDLCGFLWLNLNTQPQKKYVLALIKSYSIPKNQNGIFVITTRPPPSSTIKLYESKSIEGLLLDHRVVKPIAVNDWLLIQNKLIGVKNQSRATTREPSPANCM